MPLDHESALGLTSSGRNPRISAQRGLKMTSPVLMFQRETAWPPISEPSQDSSDPSAAKISPFDFLLSPTSPILPYEAEHACPGNDPHNALPHIAFTVPWSLSEQPAASVNWSFNVEGLPLGVQIIGKRFADIGVLRLAYLLEQLRPL